MDTVNLATQEQLPLIEENQVLQKSLDATLREIREILHRRGRLSSRNEALDEICKFLFAHVMSISHDGLGISKEGIFQQSEGRTDSSTQLKSFVKEAFEKYLPSSLAHEISHSDFELKLKPQENPLADEIITCFENLAPKAIFDSFKRGKGVDLLNDVFGTFLVDSFVDEKQLGQYLTPTEVVKFMVEIALKDMPENDLAYLCDPKHCSDFGLILDPSCGTASFLTELLKALYTRVADNYSNDYVSLWVERMVNEVVVGIDKSERMIKLALTNMAMFGFPAAKLHLANSLARSGTDANLTQSLDGKVRLILTNPPFGAEFDGKDLFEYKIATDWTRRTPSTVVSEILLLERYVNWLAPGGQCLAVVPDSILTNKGLFEDLRKNLGNKIELRSIISLPPITFSAAGTNTKTSILHFRKQPLDYAKTNKTFFAICYDIGYNVVTRGTQKAKVTTSKNDLPVILEEFTKRDAELLLARRVENVEKSIRWDANYHASLSFELEQQIKSIGSSATFISDIADLSSERIDPRKLDRDTFEYIEISDVDPRTCMVHPKTLQCSEAPSRARKVVHAGDVLFSTVRPDRRVVGVVGEEYEGIICTTGFAVLRPKIIDSLTLAYLLKTDFVISQIMRNNIGIAYPTIDESCLADIIIPVQFETLALLDNSAQEILSLERQLQQLREVFFNNVTSVVDNSLENHTFNHL